MYQGLSSILSWWSISSMMDIYKYLEYWKKGGGPIWIEHKWFKFYLPEINTWMNSDNFSLEILQYIRHKEMMYEVWIERAVIWEWNDFYTLWINKILWTHTYWWKVKTDGKNWTASLLYWLKLTENTSISLEWSYSKEESVLWNNYDKYSVSAEVSFSW